MKQPELRGAAMEKLSVLKTDPRKGRPDPLKKRDEGACVLQAYERHSLQCNAGMDSWAESTEDLTPLGVIEGHPFGT